MILDNSGLKVDLILVNLMPKCKDIWDGILKLFHALHNLSSSPMGKRFKKQKTFPFLFLILYAYEDMSIKIN